MQKKSVQRNVSALAVAQEWPRRYLYSGLFTGLAALSVLGVLLTFGMRPVYPYRWGFLMCASASFLLVAVLGGGLRTVYGRLVFSGLLCCALGDYLGFHDFIWGAMAFLVAHVFFVAAFWTCGIDWKRALRFTPAMILTGLGMFIWLQDGMSTVDKPIAVAYLVVISVMVLFAFSMVPPHRRTLIMLAASLFYISDIFVARWRFTDSGMINGYFCYPIYYSACVLFAWTACVFADERPAAVPRGD